MRWSFDPINYVKADQIKVKIWLIDNPIIKFLVIAPSMQFNSNVLTHLFTYCWRILPELGVTCFNQKEFHPFNDYLNVISILIYAKICLNAYINSWILANMVGISPTPKFCLTFCITTLTVLNLQGFLSKSFCFCWWFIDLTNIPFIILLFNQWVILVNCTHTKQSVN